MSSAMRTGSLTPTAVTAAQAEATAASRSAGASGTTGATVAGRGGAVGVTGSGRGGGAAAGGRGDRRSKKKRGPGVDFYDDGDDWLDDDEAGPGVLQ
jgi:hypothetical protein